MTRVWFNKTFSSLAAALRLIRQGDSAQQYRILCSNTNRHAPAFLAADEHFIEPKGLLGMEYAKWCLQFCAEQKIAIFVPGKEASVIANLHQEFLQVGTRVLSTASSDNLRLINDKARFCQSLDLPLAPAAEFRAVETLAQFDAAFEELRSRHHKLCIKPSSSVFGLGFAVLDEKRSSAELLLEGVPYHINLQDLRRGLEKMGAFKKMLVMEYLPGHEYSVDCVADKGRLITAVPRRKSLISGRGQTIDLREDILTSAAKLAADYQLNGFFNAQFRERTQGPLGLLEINARLSGGVAMACLAGPNLPYIGIAGFDRGFDQIEIPPIRNGIRVMEIAQATELL
ncbi:MAG TPA: ATP-grasp domain-containing protein [Marinagarivorans sp.]|nr:ATP-grasp domain-containing protein [Cellvibrionaceae bacterium]HMY39030.1 ATP-grasp domain-containing protein [Marinagarivorans sp.]HNG59146.1 ATP-grasp domain-containing protein [Cellvibrionaceae bacterium]